MSIQDHRQVPEWSSGRWLLTQDKRMFANFPHWSLKSYTHTSKYRKCLCNVAITFISCAPRKKRFKDQRQKGFLFRMIICFCASVKAQGIPWSMSWWRKGSKERENGEIPSFRCCHGAIVPVTAAVISSHLNCQARERRSIQHVVYDSHSHLYN